MKVKLVSENNDKDILNLVCGNRGIDIKNLEDFLNPDESSLMDSSSYINMLSFCKSLINAFRDNKKIGLLVDSDTDGFCSSAMLVNYFRDVLGFEDFIIIHHTDKTHGLTDEIMTKVKELELDMVVIPDAGSSDFKQHEELYGLGVEVLVIDHHESTGYSKHATVVNNHLNFITNKTLSGAGMVMKALELLDKMFDINRAHDYCDLASVAIVGDSMYLSEAETRFYVDRGLRYINNPLLAELYRMDKVRTIESISYDVAPTINAFIRVGTLEEKKDLFRALTGIEEIRAISIRGIGSLDLALPEYISRMASRIKSKQTTQVKNAIENKIFLKHENLPFTICILADEANKNLTGLIGNKLCETYNKPAIVLKRINANTYAGSGRTIDTFENFKTYIKELGIFKYAQGHEGAFGCSIEINKLEELLNLVAGKSLGDDSDCYLVDKIYIDNVSAFEIMTISDLNPYWSRGFEKPKFYIKLSGLSGDEISVIGNKKDTIRINYKGITYIKFKCTQQEVADIMSSPVNEVEIIGSFDVNEWNDRLYPQVHIEVLEFKSSPRAENNNNFNGGFGSCFNGFNF